MWLILLLLATLSTNSHANYCNDNEEVCLWFSRCHAKEPFRAVREKQEIDDECKDSFNVNQAMSDVSVKMRPESPNDWHFEVFVRNFSGTALEFGENRLEFVNASLALFHLLNGTILKEIDVPMELHPRVKNSARANFTLSLNQTLIKIFDGSVIRYSNINGTVAKYPEQELWERMKDLLWDQAHPPTAVPPDVEKPEANMNGFLHIFFSILLLIILLTVAYYAYHRLKERQGSTYVESCEMKEEPRQSFKCKIINSIA